VTLYRLQSDNHCYYGISYARKRHMLALQLDYERYCRRGGRNKAVYEILRQREYEMLTLGTFDRARAGDELRKRIAAKQTKVCLN
jgi:hypothetical protein